MMATGKGSTLVRLPDDALALIAANLSLKEQLALGRLVLMSPQSRTAHACITSTDTVAGSQNSQHNALRAAAAAAVLSNIHSCNFKLSQQGSCHFNCLQSFIHLKDLTVAIQLDDAQTVAISRAIVALAQLPVLSSLKLTRLQPQAYLPFTLDLAKAIGSLTKLQQLTLRNICISGNSTESASACMQQIAHLPALTALDATWLLHMVQPEHAVEAVQALHPILPQLQSLKLPANSLEATAAAALLDGMLGSAAVHHKMQNSMQPCSSTNNRTYCLRTLDLSGNHHMFASAHNAGTLNGSCVHAARHAVRQGLAALIAGGTLTELILADTGMMQDDLAGIVGHNSASRCSCSTGISRGQQLKRLDIHNNRMLASDHPLSLGSCLQHLQGLEHLDISWITLGPEGVAFAAQLPSLILLVMSGTRAGPAAIAALQKQRPGLKCLELFDSLGTVNYW